MAAGSRRAGERRLVFTLLAFVAALLMVACRLIFVQAIEAKRLGSLARKQHLRFVELAPKRGVIYDREGEELAVSLEADTIYATPYLIKHPQEVASQLSPILGIPYDELLKKLTRDSGFSYIARKVDKDKARKVEALEIEGIGLIKENKRCYPLNELASQTLGFVGVDGQGLAGIELNYDKILQGKPGKLLAERDPLGRSIPGGVFKLSPPQDGQSITLTIDKDIQYKAEAELRACVEAYQAVGGNIIVMNPKNGEVYAIANYPTFDLNQFSSTSAEDIRNRAITDTYEPGSTMKMVTATAVLEERLYSPQSVFHLPPTITIGGKVVKEAHEGGGCDFSLAQIVSKSSNVGAVTLGLKLGKERLYKYIETFGLTQPTGIDFPGESSGHTPPPEKWYATTIANIPFGQGASATPLQMADALGVVANDGFLVKPHLLAEVVERNGKIRKIKSDEGQKVVSSFTCLQMKGILEQVVVEGTGKAAQISGYRVGGKTGTAQKPGKGGYQEGKFVASFIGFAPVDDPQLVVLVAIDEPQEAIYGGVVAAPAFKNVMEFSLRHLRIPPSN